MEFLKRLAQKINGNVITRNLVLAACGLVILVFLAQIMLNMFTRHGQVREVPDFSGMTVKEALKAGRGGNLSIEINDSLYAPQFEGGVILEQNPSPGAKVKSGRSIFVTVNSFSQKKVEIPYVTGFSLRQAKNNLEVAGFVIDRIIYRSDIATNNVLEQKYDGKTITPRSRIEAEIGSGVTLIVGLAPDAGLQPVPRIVGFSLREAKSRLWEAGFNIGRITRDEGVTTINEREAKVYSQSPPVGSRQNHGSDIDMSITLDEDKVAKGITAAERAATAAARALRDSLDNAAQ